MLRALLWRIRALFGRGRLDEEFDLEVQDHLEMLRQRFIRQGMTPAEALHAARRQFGGVTQVKERYREANGLRVLDVLLRDARQAFREVRASRRLTVAAAATLALGIGAATTVFAVLDAVALRPLPYPSPDRLVALATVDRRGTPHQVSYPNFFDFREQNRVFDRVASYREAPFTVTDTTPGVSVTAEIVSWDLFPLLGVEPELGRGFRPEEERPGTHVAVLSHVLWTTQFNGDRQIVGNRMSLNGIPFTVVGVARPGFQFPVDVPRVDLWVTLSEDGGSTAQRGARMLDVIGRLRPGVSIEQARAQMDSLSAALARQYPDTNSNSAAAWVEPEWRRLAGPAARAMWLLSGAVAVLLFMACANVASLLLARGADRAREFVLRIALGASRFALVRQLIIENTALGLLGTAGGIFVSMGALKAILPLTGGRIPRLSAVEIDARVLAFAAALAVVTSLLFGIAPVLQASAVNPAAGLKEGARSIAPGRDRFRSGLVMIQVALGLVLLVAANLLMGGFVTLIRSDPGFQADRLLTVDLGASAAQFPVAEQIAFSDRLLERLRGIPTIRAAAAGTPLPLQGHEMRMAFDIEERRAAMPDRPRSDIAIVTPGYFAAMGIPLVQGRDFTDRDGAGSPPVVVVNQAFARKYFPGSNAIGKRIQPGTGLPPPMREIVGIVGNARQGASGAGDDPIYYFPYKQLPWRLGTVVLRTAGQPEEVEVDVRAALAGLDRRIAIRQVRSGEALALSLLAPAKFLTVLVGSFATIALLLTATGLYGVLSYMVAKRQREIGVRLALGAARRDVVRIVSRQAVLLVVPGLAVGALGAVAVTRLAGNVVFGIAVAAPLMVVAACAAVALISAAAAFLPATRAAAVDPIQVLRAE